MCYSLKSICLTLNNNWLTDSIIAITESCSKLTELVNMHINADDNGVERYGNAPIP